MRKVTGCAVGICYLIWIVVITLILSADYQILDPEELTKLKDGKNFWEWSSKHGRLQVHYTENGTGDRHLILLHGFRAHTYTWRHLVAPLVAAGYHVWTIDLIGYGLSDKPDHVPYSFDFFIEQIYAFLEDQKISQAHVIGNSMGGGLALSLATTYPEKVRSLTLISALGYPIEMPLYLSLGRHFNRIWVHFLGPTMIRSGLRQIIFKRETVTDEQVEAYSLPYRFPGGALASVLTLRKFDNQHLIELGQKYPSLTQPMLVIWGEHDTLLPVSHYEKFCQDFPQAHRLLIPHCGHLAQEEEPQQVADALLEFLKQIEDRP